jgi:prophage regulatory protein
MGLLFSHQVNSTCLITRGFSMATNTANHPAILPTAGFIRETTVLIFVPISRATLWRKVKSGEFPKPVKLGPKITAWKVEAVREYLDSIGGGQ